ncbi:MAG TPA: hypothetical protein VG818_13000 [Gemmatimonadaceae bacterium]|jgi:hypothetical protein|nr:hypothetical protein [Gemmatimonadaceae bacterium]
MSEASRLDVRVPIGVLFVVLGLLLAGYGWATAGAPSGNSPLADAWWGLVMLGFGAAMLALAWAGARRR